jgi:nucleotide-binding universal stress UspA family protein
VFKKILLAYDGSEPARKAFERWLLGSVSRVVIAYARCAVLVVR